MINLGFETGLTARMVLSLGLLLCTFSSHPAVADCRGMVADYFNWINQNRGTHDGAHAVGVKMAAVKIRERNPERYPWGHGSYAEGRLGWHGDELTGRLKVLFSDRRSAQSNRRFDPARSDVQDVTVYADGRVRVVLVSWGNTSLFLQDVRCYQDGFITGVKREGNGTSMVSLALRKEVIRPGRDGFRDWP